MEGNYYIIKNGQQLGPMTAEELLRYGLNPDSIVWHPGMSDWGPAANIPELSALLYGNRQQQEPQGVYPSIKEPQMSQGAPYPQNQTPGYSQHPFTQPFGSAYQQPYMPPRERQRSKWLTPAIIATVVGFILSCIGGILGVVGIIQASNANNAFDRGDIFEGERLDSNAKIWTIISFVLSGLSLLCCFIYIIFFVGALGTL